LWEKFLHAQSRAHGKHWQKKCEELRRDNWRHSVAFSGMSTIPVPEVKTHTHISNIPQQKAPLLS